ncbi:hypothetical protein [Bradyrhizobium japonicum]|uniref:hypothetical protein n=1 Tax=Bradyrhizobium japonicum TaxID=375 RepID=UPI001BA52352|nr:hypothetical protein [Bradyrhizobium japonicum]MBR0764217.1 hypothetical protein [Bradyrhizobium japonicum]
MPGKYRGVILGAKNKVLEECNFPLCAEDTGAKNTIKSYASATFPDHEFVEVWNGRMKVAKFNRAGTEVDFS